MWLDELLMRQFSIYQHHLAFRLF